MYQLPIQEWKTFSPQVLGMLTAAIPHLSALLRVKKLPRAKSWTFLVQPKSIAQLIESHKDTWNCQNEWKPWVTLVSKSRIRQWSIYEECITNFCLHLMPLLSCSSTNPKHTLYKIPEFSSLSWSLPLWEANLQWLAVLKNL